LIQKPKVQLTNGAGDSFFSGDECLKLGTICAGFCITSKELAFGDLSKELLGKGVLITFLFHSLLV